MASEKPVIYIDSECLVCNGFAKFVSSRDDGLFLYGKFSSERIQDIIESEDVGETIVLETDNEYYFRSDAVLKIFKHLDWPYSFLSILIFVPRPVRDIFYSIFRDYRKKLFGPTEKCVLDENLMERSI